MVQAYNFYWLGRSEYERNQFDGAIKRYNSVKSQMNVPKCYFWNMSATNPDILTLLNGKDSNCIYESVWKDNRRRSQERFLVQDIINKYSSDYKIIIVGDATMAPYEITNAGGSIEHWNEEAGHIWIKRLSEHFENMAWLNPVPDDHWDYTSSICIIKDLFENRMYPLTLKGLEDGMAELSK